MKKQENIYLKDKEGFDHHCSIISYMYKVELIGFHLIVFDVFYRP